MQVSCLWSSYTRSVFLCEATGHVQELGPNLAMQGQCISTRSHRAHARIRTCLHGQYLYTWSGRTRPQGTYKNISTWFDTAESAVYTLVHISKVTPVVQLALILKYLNSHIWICGYTRHSKNVYTKPLREFLAIKLSDTNVWSCKPYKNK